MAAIAARPSAGQHSGVAVWVVRNRSISASRGASRRRKYESSAAATVVPWFEAAVEDGLDAETATAGP